MILTNKTELLKVMLDGEVVLEAPLIVHDSAKAREALVRMLEAGTGYGIDQMFISAIFRATAEHTEPGDYTGLLIQASTERQRLTV